MHEPSGWQQPPGHGFGAQVEPAPMNVEPLDGVQNRWARVLHCPENAQHAPSEHSEQLPVDVTPPRPVQMEDENWTVHPTVGRQHKTVCA